MALAPFTRTDGLPNVQLESISITHAADLQVIEPGLAGDYEAVIERLFPEYGNFRYAALERGGKVRVLGDKLAGNENAIVVVAVEDRFAVGTEP